MSINKCLLAKYLYFKDAGPILNSLLQSEYFDVLVVIFVIVLFFIVYFFIYFQVRI